MEMTDNTETEPLHPESFTPICILCLMVGHAAQVG